MASRSCRFPAVLALVGVLFASVAGAGSAATLRPTPRIIIGLAPAPTISWGVKPDPRIVWNSRPEPRIFVYEKAAFVSHGFAMR